MTAAFGISFTAEAEVTHGDANRAVADANQAAMRAQEDLAASHATAVSELADMHTDQAGKED